MPESMVAYRSFVGVDLHKCTVTLVAVGPDGQVIAKLKISTRCVPKIAAGLRDLPGPQWMAVGACPFVERIGKPKANVAMGRRLLRILYAMARGGKPCRRGGGSRRPAAANQARLARKRRKEAA